MSDKINYQYFEEQLLCLQEEILGVASLVDESAQTVELDQNKVGRLSRMDAMQGQAMAQASVERQDLQLKRIEAALDRIEKREFGLCQACGKDIPLARLEVDLTAEHCITCAQKIEQR